MWRQAPLCMSAWNKKRNKYSSEKCGCYDESVSFWKGRCTSRSGALNLGLHPPWGSCTPNRCLARVNVASSVVSVLAMSSNDIVTMSIYCVKNWKRLTHKRLWQTKLTSLNGLFKVVRPISWIDKSSGHSKQFRTSLQWHLPDIFKF